MRSHNRGYQATPAQVFRVPITLHYLGSRGVRTTRGMSLNISEGGLGALVQGTLAGETVAIDFPLQEPSLGRVAIVRRTSNVQSGFEFLGLTADERQQITNVRLTQSEQGGDPIADGAGGQTTPRIDR